MAHKKYYVYIMTNQNHTVLYTGVTDDLLRRVLQHRAGKGGSFSNRYKLYNLVYYEEEDDVLSAIAREKQIKAGSRQEKTDLLNSLNPGWKDLFEEAFD